MSQGRTFLLLLLLFGHSSGNEKVFVWIFEEKEIFIVRSEWEVAPAEERRQQSHRPSIAGVTDLGIFQFLKHS